MPTVFIVYGTWCTYYRLDFGKLLLPFRVHSPDYGNQQQAKLWYQHSTTGIKNNSYNTTTTTIIATITTTTTTKTTTTTTNKGTSTPCEHADTPTAVSQPRHRQQRKEQCRQKDRRRYREKQACCGRGRTWWAPAFHTSADQIDQIDHDLQNLVPTCHCERLSRICIH